MAVSKTTTGKIIEGLAKMVNKVAPLYVTEKKPQASRYVSGFGQPFSWTYTGEKNLGELGPARDYYPDYQMLRVRSWQSYLESEISRTILNKYKTWIVGTGLRLQSEPMNRVLESEGLGEIQEEFTQMVEGRFKVFGKMCDIASEQTLDRIADDVFKNATIGGDVLCVLRYIKGQVKIQIIDGHHVQSPNFKSITSQNGNQIYHGIEIDKDGKHLAYHVKEKNRTVRIPAYNNGIRTAFMVYGDRYRLDNHRGLPLIAVVLETLKKLERYREAMVGSAEERAKVAVVQEHSTQSTGENVFQSRLVKAVDPGAMTDVPQDINANAIADSVAVSTNKQLINMPIDSTLKFLESKTEFYFKEFYEANANPLCSALEIPPNVAFSIYNDSFSASRAATKDWEHTISVKRANFSEQFYQRIYRYWFEIQVLKNKIQAPGYLGGEEEVKLAYLNARWTGAMFPHIDPEKEARAERIKLGPNGDHLPLCDLESSTETLGGGDSMANLKQFAKEIEMAEGLGIKPLDKTPKEPNQAKS